jgi:glycine cleavage system H protein
MAFVELPPLGKVVSAGQPVCAVDSLKSTSEVYAPVSGTVVEVNGKLTPEGGVRLVNTDPLGEGWLFVLELADPAELDSLMPFAQYASYVGRESDRGPEGPGPR